MGSGLHQLEDADLLSRRRVGRAQRREAVPEGLGPQDLQLERVGRLSGRPERDERPRNGVAIRLNRSNDSAEARLATTPVRFMLFSSLVWAVPPLDNGP